MKAHHLGPVSVSKFLDELNLRGERRRRELGRAKASKMAEISGRGCESWPERSVEDRWGTSPKQGAPTPRGRRGASFGAQRIRTK